MKEVWIDIQGYEGLYQVSNLGNSKSLDRVISNRNYKGKLLKSSKTKGGYLQVSLWEKNKLRRCYIHRLVAEAFIPNPLNLPCVNHKDEDKTNNCIENLEWCSYEYNNSYGTRTERISKTLTNGKKVLQLRMDGSLVRIWPSVREVERQLHFNKGSISECCLGKRHTAHGYKWCYAKK